MFKHLRVLWYFLFIFMCFSTPALNAQSNEIEIPNVFTPNGDKINDLFVVNGLSDQWTLRIYDRWGTLVFASDNFPENGWDGHNILGLEAITGVYFYIIEKKDVETFYKGTIHLLR